MYTLSPHATRQSLLVQPSLSHAQRIRQQLQTLGVTKAAQVTMTGRYLPQVLHSDEDIVGVVYGRSKEGFAMLVATDRRTIFLSKKPLFVNEDEITYDVVSGVTYGHAGFGSTIILHTRVKDYKIQTLNDTCARMFMSAIESRCVEQARQQQRGYRQWL